MEHETFTKEYQEKSLSGEATPLQLMLMLYDRAIEFMEAGRLAIDEGNLEIQNKNLQKAQRIVMELMSCLDMEKGGDVARNLQEIYTYVLNALVEANISDDPKPVTNCIKIFTDLRASWIEAEQAKIASETSNKA